jgi:hypothetical protein
VVEATGGRRFHELPYRRVPDGAFVFEAGAPYLVFGQQLLRWSPGGYRTQQRRPARGSATLITPPSLLALLERDWTPVVPLLHPTAIGSDRGADE